MQRPLRDGSGPWQETLFLGLFANLLLRPLTSQSLLYAELGARLQIVGVTFYFLNDVFRLNFALEPTQGALNGLAFLQSNFCQTKSPPNPALIGHAKSLPRSPLQRPANPTVGSGLL